MNYESFIVILRVSEVRRTPFLQGFASRINQSPPLTERSLEARRSSKPTPSHWGRSFVQSQSGPTSAVGYISSVFPVPQGLSVCMYIIYTEGRKTKKLIDTP